jgi:hypothetical protein
MCEVRSTIAESLRYTWMSTKARADVVPRPRKLLAGLKALITRWHDVSKAVLVMTCHWWRR